MINRTPAWNDGRPRQVTKQEFGRRLYKAMLNKGWNQSELSRRSGLTRDSISTYITGKVLPTEPNLIKLAGVLGVDPGDLLMNYMPMNPLEPPDQDNAMFEFRVSSKDPTKAHVKLDRILSLGTAMQIANLLSEHDAPAE